MKSTTALGDLDAGDWTDDEREKLAAGLVPLDGEWMSPERRDKILDDRREERAARIAEAQKHRKWKDRHVEQSKNFEFHYTIDPEDMKGFIELMETYFKEFTREWRIRKPRGVDRLKVCFYHDEDYYHQVSGAPSGVIGYYRFVPPRELSFYFERLDPEMTVDVMFHETNHYLTHLIDLDFKYPPWVNESLAEYYGASEWDPDSKDMKIGNLQEGRLAVIQDEIKADRWQGLEDLIRTEQGSFNAVHYAWGWSLVHFLMSDRRYERGFKSFYLGLAKDKNIERELWFHRMKHVPPDAQIDALKKYLRLDSLEELEKEWHDYVRGLEAASHRGYHRAGQIALSRGMPIKAQRLFGTALEMGSENPQTHYGYGRALMQKGKYDEALAQFEAAIEKDPLEGMYYVRKAECLRRGRDADSDSAALKQLYELAAQVDPDDYDVILAKAMWEAGEFGSEQRRR